MGIFYSVFYACFVLGPWIAGLLARATGGAQVALDFGVVLLLMSCAALWLFRRNTSDAPSK